MKRSRARAKKGRSGRAGSRPTANKKRTRKEWMLRLYTAGESVRSLAALRNLKAICEKHLAGRYQIEVVNLMEHPQLARGDQIVALPTLVRRLPAPMKKIIGDLSDEDRVLVGLDLRPLPARSRLQS